MSTRRSTSFRIGALAMALLSSVVSARPQEPTVSAVPRGTEGRASRIDDERALWCDGRAIRGGGARYRVDFERGAMTIAPALGRVAPRTMSLRVECSSIERDGEPVVALCNRVDPEIDREGCVLFRHGEVLERYEVRSEGVAQSFVFPSPLDGRGDLVVRLALHTELRSARTGTLRAPEALDFTLPGVGGLRYGNVNGVDAAGNMIDGSLRHREGFLELVLPASFVDRATYPLVLDPLIGPTFEVGVAGNDEDDSDVAYFEGTDEYLFVYVREFSRVDTEIRAQRVDGASHAKLSSFLRLTNTPGSTFNIEPAVACVKTTGRFLVAWQAGPSPFGPWEVHCCAVDAGTGAFTGVVTAASGASSYHSPDVGGERIFDDEALLVYDDDSIGIVASQVNVPSGGGAPSVASPVRLAAGVGSTRRFPAISKSGGNVGRYLVVFETADGLGAQAVDRQLARIGGNLFLVSPSGRERTMPDVDGDGTSFVVTYAEAETPGGTLRDVYAQPAAVDATASRWSGGREPVAAATGVDEYEPAIGFLGPKHAVAWTRASSTFLRSSILMKGIDPQSCVPCSDIWLVHTGSQAERSAKIGSKWAGGASSDRCMITFTSYDRSTLSGDVLARAYSAIGSGGGVRTVAPGCGGGGTLSVANAFAFGNTVDIALGGADTRAMFCVLHIGLPTATIASCGSCQYLPPEVILGGSITRGFALWQLRIPCELVLRGQTIRMQTLVLPTTAQPCLGLGLGMSNILDASLGF